MPDPVPGPASQPQDELPPEGIILPLDVVRSSGQISAATVPRLDEDEPKQKPYSPEKQRDYVRLTVTVGLLFIFGYLVVFASIESASWPQHWQQTKEMLQIILPAITGIIGTVIGFYFGSTTNRNGIGNDTE